MKINILMSIGFLFLSTFCMAETELQLIARIEKNLADNSEDTENAILSYSSIEQEKNQESILVIDDAMRPASALLVYASRVLAIYSSHENDDQLLHEDHFSYKVPKKMQEVAKIIRENQIPVEKLRKVSPQLLALMKKVVKVEGNSSTSHGTRIFELLANYNPQEKFVLTEFPSPPMSELCDLDENVEKLENYFSKSTDELSSIIEKHQVKMVNMSLAFHYHKWLSEMRTFCTKPLAVKGENIERFLRAKSMVLKQLALRHPQVVFVKAAPNDFSHFPSAFDAEINCFKESNIFVVGHFSEINSQIGFSGIPLEELHFDRLSEQKFNVNCAGLYINGGMDQNRSQHMELDEYWMVNVPTRLRWWDEFSLFENYHGVFDVPLPAMSTSYAAPLALSMINFILKHNPRLKNHLQQVKERLLNGAFDPIRNQQLLLYQRLRSFL